MYMFSEILRETRKIKGLSQIEMAEKLNISRTAYGDYERGRTEPDISTLKKISSILEVSVDYLIDNKQISEYILIKQSDYESLLDILKKYHKK